jgi:peptidoglycan/xylan/chitin deacetylase (PgdA/CDA1 family)
VGILFAKTRTELLHFAPRVRPQYGTTNENPFDEPLGENEEEDPFHYAGSLVEQIAKAPFQEIATHTFSHYYACASWASVSTFAADIEAAKAIANARGVELKSIVFPRNQVNDLAVETIREAGLTHYRGNPDAWEWNHHAPAARAFRLADSYLPLRNSQAIIHPSSPTNVLATRFLRPVNSSVDPLRSFRVARIKREMTLAARNGGLYHLWWHPQNFGVHLDQNMNMLRDILNHHAMLDETFGMTSQTMAETSA